VTLYTWLPLGNGQAPGDLVTYQAGLEAYRSGAWSEAWALLSRLSAQGMGPARTLCQRIESLNKQPPENWDGIWQLQK
jgi:hypothetical protein